MRIRFTHPAVSLALTAALVVTACSSAATPVPTKAPTAARQPQHRFAPTATPLPGSKKFTVAFTSRGISSVAMMEGDRRPQQGRLHDRLPGDRAVEPDR